MPSRERVPGEDLTPERLAAMSREERFVHLGGWAAAPTASVRGTYWRRKDPVRDDDAGNTIIVSGFARVETAPEAFADAIIIESAEFGGIGEGWTGPKELLTFEEFAESYNLLSQADREALADDQATASKFETQRVANLTPAQRNAEAAENLRRAWA